MGLLYILQSLYILAPKAAETKRGKNTQTIEGKPAPDESNAEESSFEWPHFGILSRNSKVRTTLYSIISSTTGKYCSVAFI